MSNLLIYNLIQTFLGGTGSQNEVQCTSRYRRLSHSISPVVRVRIPALRIADDETAR